MKTEKFIIGMDGGGTKTHAVITTEEGRIVAEHTAGPSNFQIIGTEKAAKIIFSLIQKCCASASCNVSDIRSIVCGLTGAGRIGDQRRMAAALKRYARTKKVRLNNVLVESDARIALEGAFKGGTGIILIAGTGSIAFGKDSKGNVHRVGGWGRTLGDEGSGFYVGRLGLTAVTRSMDGRGADTLLTGMIARKFGLSDQTKIITAVYKKNFDIASIAPFVISAAQRKDKVCRAIIESAVIELAWHIEIAAGKIYGTSSKQTRKKIPVSFIGGLIAGDTIVSRLLKKYLKTNFPFVTVIPPLSSPAYGATVMASTK